ncbi:MFS transporter [Tsukamurella strandjordii]|uniref:MFS transporter n=1 Tax=Tsukamurella strandjordii TaxID=147577 RepID=A0AA90N8W1_9ACTN|nr:MFS transporter [Tsukamurella strandjordii]MDP0397158.1 MFS transporter [Tsukamurella strandjordii]
MPASSPAPSDADGQVAPPRSRLLAWCSWDWGSASFNVVIVTFVFSVYLTDSVGKNLPGSIPATAYLSGALATAGVLVAVLAPVLGQRSDEAGRRRFSLAVWSALLFLTMLGCFFVRDDYQYLWLGLLLLATGTVFFELANVPYYAMLRQVSTPATIGRVSGIGWASGYFGGIVILLVCYLGFISGEGDTRGFLGLSTEGGMNIRLVALFAALWFGIFALPVLFAVPEVPRDPAAPARRGLVDSYRALFASVAQLWRADRNAVYFLIASAVFRDGLTATFSFGAVLAVSVYGMSASTVLLFGVAANVFAAIGALVAGRFDDSVGPKAVIVVSLVGMIIAGIVLLFVSGTTMFWIFGLMLTVFVGPAQSSARSLLARMATPGHEGQMFGLYQTTGRAASFLAPALFTLFVAVFGTDRAGIAAIVLVLALGLAMLLPVTPSRDRALTA